MKRNKKKLTILLTLNFMVLPFLVLNPDQKSNSTISYQISIKVIYNNTPIINNIR